MLNDSLNFTDYVIRLGINLHHSFDNLIQHQRSGDVENGIPHILGIGAILVGVEVFDEGKHPPLHRRVQPSGRKVVEHKLFELIAQNGSLPHLHLIDKNAPVGQAQHGTLFSALVVGGIQVEDEREIGHLLHHVQGIGNTAGPKGLPIAVNFIFS